MHRLPSKPTGGARWKTAALRSPKLLVLFCTCFFPLRSVASVLADDFRVRNLPGNDSLPSDAEIFAGLLPVSERTNVSEPRALFFWYHKARHSTEPGADERLLFWFAGGPGCSSVKEVFSHNGPLVFNNDGQIKPNDRWSLVELASIVFVDSPYGTGFSRVPNATDVRIEEDVAADFRQFLKAFGDIFPELYHNEVYLAGQGYAGMSVPYMARSILERDRRAEPGALQVNLRGIVLANGLVSPVFHYGSVLRHLKKFDEVYRKLTTHIQRVLQAEHQTLMHHYYHDTKLPVVPHHWVEFKALVLKALQNVTGPCFDWHDILRVRRPEDCEEAGNGNALATWLNRLETLSTLHVPEDSAKWLECRPGELLTDDASSPSYMLFDSLLRDIRIVLYNGDQDMYANHVGTEEFLRTLSWGGLLGKLGWENATLVSWGGYNRGLADGGDVATVNGTESGYWALANAERGLAYLRVLRSGYDTSDAKPEVVYNIFKDFVFRDEGIRFVMTQKNRLIASGETETDTKSYPAHKGLPEAPAIPSVASSTPASTISAAEGTPGALVTNGTAKADNSAVPPAARSHIALYGTLGFIAAMCGVGFCVCNRSSIPRPAALRRASAGLMRGGGLFSGRTARSEVDEARSRGLRVRYAPITDQAGT